MVRLGCGLLFVTLATGLPAATKGPGGECFWVRGRLSAANGNPTFRLWPIGTHRMLGVTGALGESESPKLPANVRDLRPSFDRNIWGRFRVCPQTADKSGWMRFVTVEEGRDLSVTSTR